MLAIIDVEILQQVSTAATLKTPIYQKLLENVDFLEVQREWQELSEPGEQELGEKIEGVGDAYVREGK